MVVASDQLGRPVRVAEFVSEFGRWDEADRAADPRLRRYVHGYFATSSALARPVWHRHLPTAEVPLVLNFGAPHARLEARPGSRPQRLEQAWVAGLQTRHHRSEAVGERRFMVVRFTPLGAHLFFRLSMDSLTDQAVPLEQVDPGTAALVHGQVLTARSWPDRFAAMERMIGSCVDRSAALPGIEWAWDRLVRTQGRAPVGSLAAAVGCSQRHLIQQFRSCVGLTPKKTAMLLRFSRAIDVVTRGGPAGPPRKPYLEGMSLPGAAGPGGGGWARVATDCGYSDQSHFIHEFRAFAGATPTEFLRGTGTR